ncbi:MAG: iron donor protein CyaY [Acidobacteriaceae bacterium]|nr:iron donor protein CyaY [Acidobacteriaceae bacterium]
MDEQEFKNRADEALNSLYRKLSRASEQYEFEPDFNSGALAIEFDEPKAKFVISPNTPVRQVWVSAHSKSFKLDWNDSQHAFVLPETGQTLDSLIAESIEKLVGEPVSL